MIPKHVKDNFLNRKLDNFDYIKDYSDEEILSYIKEVAPETNFNIKPFTHQLACYVLGLENPKFYFMLQMGLGKTFISIMLMNYYLKTNKIHKVLILAPKLQHLYTWEEELKKFAPHLTYTVLDGSTEYRKELIENNNSQIFILNYVGLSCLVSDYTKIQNKKNKKETGKLITNLKKIKWITDKFDMMICDEAQAIKDWKSLNYTVCKLLSEKMKYVYLLSGTPFNDPQDLWSQFYVMDKGITLGHTLGMFRECFFTTTRNRWGGFEHKFINKMRNKLNEVIKNKSIHYEGDVKGLPEQIFNKIYVKFDEETRGYYDKVIKDFTHDKDFRTVNNAFIQMRMLTSGFLGFVNDNNDEKINITFKQNPKLEALIDTISTIPVDSKIIVFNEFIHSGDMISKEFDKNKIKHVRLYGGTKDVKHVLDTFLHDPSCRVLLTNNQSGSEGLNLMSANYTIYYEMPLSSITYQQGLKRTHRTGQKKTCYYYYLMVKDSVDEKIYFSLKTGKDLFDSIINGLDK